MDSEIASRKRAYGYTETGLYQGNPKCPECGSPMQKDDFGIKAKCHECNGQEYKVSKITRVFVKPVEEDEEVEERR